MTDKQCSQLGWSKMAKKSKKSIYIRDDSREVRRSYTSFFAIVMAILSLISAFAVISFTTIERKQIGMGGTISGVGSWVGNWVSRNGDITQRLDELDIKIQYMQRQIDSLAVSDNRQCSDTRLSDLEQRITEIENETSALKAITPIASSEYQLLVFELDRVRSSLDTRLSDSIKALERHQDELATNLNSRLNTYMTIFGWSIAAIFLLVTIAFAVIYFTVQGRRDKKEEQHAKISGQSESKASKNHRT